MIFYIKQMMKINRKIVAFPELNSISYFIFVGTFPAADLSMTIRL